MNTITVFEEIKKLEGGKLQVLLTVKISDSSNITVVGVRPVGATLDRGVSHSVLQNSDDFRVWCKVSDFADTEKLPGRSCSYVFRGKTRQARIVSAHEHALGDLVVLTLGSYEKVTA